MTNDTTTEGQEGRGQPVLIRDPSEPPLWVDIAAELAAEEARRHFRLVPATPEHEVPEVTA